MAGRTGSGRRGDGPRRGIGLALALTAGAVAGLALLGTAAALSVATARSFVIWPRRRPDDIPILRVDSERGLIVLGRTEDSAVPGRYGLWFEQDSGYARIGQVVAEHGGTVTRALLGVDLGEISGARRGRMSGWFYRHPRELGLPYRGIEVATPLGYAPAWHLPVAVDEGGAPVPNRRWAVVVHGHGVVRAEGLRAVAPFHAEGLDVLLISFRNDGEAPPSPDQRTSLGDREWADVEAAMDAALGLGAEELVLMGFSLGGATVLQTATRARGRDRVVGLVLDSPVIDWVTTLDAIGADYRMPLLVREGAFLLARVRWGRRLTGLDVPIDWGRMDFVARARELRTPILLMHSDDDGYVPPGPSQALAAARPDIVRFDRWSQARHAKLWNYDPERWEASIRGFLSGLGAGAQRSRRRA